MTSPDTLLARHPVPAYFALTFAISWGGVLIVVGPGGIPGTTEEFERLLPMAVLAMLAGPSVAGLLLTGLVYGRAGFRDLLSRLFRWRVGTPWFAIALLTAPLLMLGLLLVLSLFSPVFRPVIFGSDDKATILLTGIIIALSAGFIEELGWTGFAIPTLRRRAGVVTTGIIVGLMWAAWHLLVAYWASGASSGALSLASFLLDPLLFLAAFRVLMVWVYDRTGSLLVAMLMHASLTGSARILGAFGPGPIPAAPLLIFDVAWAAAVCILIAAIGAANGFSPIRPSTAGTRRIDPASSSTRSR